MNPYTHHAQITFEDEESSLQCLLGDGSIEIVEGFGGWTSIERPRRVALSTWEGHAPLKLDIPIVLGLMGASQGYDADAEVRTLMRFAGRGKGGGVEPPVLTITTPSGQFMPLGGGTGTEWVIDNLSFDDRVFGTSGKLVRVLATVTVLQHVTDRNLTESAAAARLALRKTAPKSYRTVRGDTWKRVAMRVWGDPFAKYAGRIRKANPKVKDSHGVLPTGTKLKIPTKPKA